MKKKSVQLKRWMENCRFYMYKSTNSRTVGVVSFMNGTVTLEQEAHRFDS